jgi:O-antigen/teichoic acid export membrane protein
VLNIALIYYAGALGAAIASLLSISATSVYSFYLLWEILEFDVPVYDIGLQFLGGGVMYTIVLGAMQIYPPTDPITTVLLGGFGAVVYVSVMVVISSEIRQKVVEVLNKLNSTTTY